MLKITIGLCSPEEFTLGFTKYTGEDEDGEFEIFIIGFLFFDISFIKY